MCLHPLITSDKIQIVVSRCVKEIVSLWPEYIIRKYASALRNLIEVLLFLSLHSRLASRLARRKCV